MAIVAMGGGNGGVKPSGCVFGGCGFAGAVASEEGFDAVEIVSSFEATYR